MSIKKRVALIGNREICMQVIAALEPLDSDVIHYDPPKKSKQKKIKYSKPAQRNQWRGGSRGKGGKTKWPKR